ncbi:hypothetical protein BGW37DRAFT_486941 [Umbelopsis sp. PMI_123]|nr:hypothetical protein BGW37DRAFT_486941 [Umbelopsis sp. PMI_123]
MIRNILSKPEKDLCLQAFETFEICRIRDEAGFKFQPGDVFISSKQLLDILENGKEYQSFGHGILVPTSLILQSITACLSKISPSNTAKRQSRTPKDKHKQGLSNSFLAFNGTFRKKIYSALPEYRQSEISKLSGALWRASSLETKILYKEKAAQQNSILKEFEDKYPNYSVSKRYKKRKGRFVNRSFSDLCNTESSNNKNDLASFCGVPPDDNLEDYLVMSLATVSCDANTGEHEDDACPNALLDNINQDSSSCQVLSWMDEWNPDDSLTNEDDFVTWSRASNGLSIYVGSIHQNFYQSSYSLYSNNINIASYEQPIVPPNIFLHQMQLE